MSEENEYLETINCLKQSYSLADNVVRSSAEKRLKELGKINMT
jgi:hypothetical protein